MRIVRGALLGAAFLAAGCAGASREQKPAAGAGAPDRSIGHTQLVTQLVLPETVIIASPPEERALEGLDETQLFDCGVRAFDSADWNRAAACFGRLVDAFPVSDHFGAALFNCALSLERAHRYAEALTRWDADLDRLAPKAGASAPSSDELDATFHAAYCEHEVGKLDEAAARLKLLAERPGIPDARKGEALVQVAVCRVEKVELLRKAGERDSSKLEGRGEGEHLLREAIDLYGKAASDGEADPVLLAQAEFWIGEIYRSYFDEIRLDPSVQDENGLLDTLESKAQFLLSAQGHYLRAIRRGDGEWATASGYRVGELYESLHQQMIDAPVPKGLTAEQQGVYREELKKKVRVLLDKAMKIYAQTLQTAQRVNATSDYVRKTNEALERMRALLVEETPSTHTKPASRTN